MAQSKTLMIQIKTRANAWRDNMIANDSMVSKRIENFRLSQPNPSLFWQHFVSRCRGNKQLVNHYIMNVPRDLLVVYKSKYPFSVNTYNSQYSKTDESRNTYKCGEVSCSVNLV